MYSLFVRHVLPILYVYFSGTRFGCRAHSLHSGTGSRIIVQVVASPGTRTSPPTSWAARRSARCHTLHSLVSDLALLGDSPRIVLARCHAPHSLLSDLAAQGLVIVTLAWCHTPHSLTSSRLSATHRTASSPTVANLEPQPS